MGQIVMNSLMKLENIWKVYGGEREGEVKVNALQSINLEINDGEFIAILGPSGSGKSTLMNLFGILDAPSNGKIFVDGQDLSRFSENKTVEIRGKKIGFVFQSFNLISTLTALENVSLPLIFQGVNEEERNKIALKLLREVGLELRVNHFPSQLSGGEQQRVAVARALVNDPPIILADEPTGNLDSKNSEGVMKLLQKLNKKGKTIIFITHNKTLAKFAGRIINMVDGKINGKIADKNKK